MTTIGGKISIRLPIVLVAILLAGIGNNAYAHPGRTDSSGGHTCRTNCPSWGLSYGEYHYHNGGYTAPSTYTATAPAFVYATPVPTPTPLFSYDEEYAFSSAVTSYDITKQVADNSRSNAESSDGFLRSYYTDRANEYDTELKTYEAAFLKTLNKAFKHVFGRSPDSKEKEYWMDRIKQGDIASTDALVDKLEAQKKNGQTMPGKKVGSVLGAKTTAKTGIANVPVVVAKTFKEVYGRDIKPSESTYWKKRARSDKDTVAALKGAMIFHRTKGVTH